MGRISCSCGIITSDCGGHPKECPCNNIADPEGSAMFIGAKNVKL